MRSIPNRAPFLTNQILYAGVLAGKRVDDHDELASVYGAAAAPGTAFQAQLSASNVADAMAAVDVLPPVMWE